MSRNKFREQFLLTKESGFTLNWEKYHIRDYTLHYHPELDFTASKQDDLDLILLGFIYDWEFPELSNQQILDKLCQTTNFDSFLNDLAKYMGKFVIIYSIADRFLLLNDAAALREIYYNTDFTTFGSQPKLLSEVIAVPPHTDVALKELYESPMFASQKLFVYDSTHLSNIKHLLPNHCIDVDNKLITRFFPSEKMKTHTTAEAAKIVAKMLKGYLAAINCRQKLAMAFTGGIDSRTLFFASHETDCKYYVFHGKKMKAHHPDITIPKKFCEMFAKPFEVLQSYYTVGDIDDSIDFPTLKVLPVKPYTDRVYINGNISEIGRSLYGSIKKSPVKI
jgi:hypothetical protein